MTFVANSFVSPRSIGGGDRIFIEFARYWHSPRSPVTIYASEEGERVSRENLPEAIQVKKLSSFAVAKYGLLWAYIRRIVQGWRIASMLPRCQLIYSTSDFLTDVVVAYRVKRLHPSTFWLAGFYLVAPNPFRDHRWRTLRGILSWTNQQISILLIRKHANHIFVLSGADKSALIHRGIEAHRISIITGGIDLRAIEATRQSSKKYEGCFVGRFHPQKGLPDLLSTWKSVQNKLPGARLAVIGWEIPEVVKRLKAEIARMELSDVIDVLGFLDGKAKWTIMKASKVLLFPSSYESFGITALESLACGTPVVAYDLPIFRETFGEVLSLAPVGDVQQFAKRVLEVSMKVPLRKKLSREGERIARQFDWSTVAHRAWQELQPDAN